MHDALVEIAHAVQANSELLAISAQGVDLSLGHRICDRLVRCRSSETLWSSVAIVRSGRRNWRPARRSPSNAWWSRHFVNEVEIDVDEVGILPLPFHDKVVVPHLLGRECVLSVPCLPPLYVASRRRTTGWPAAREVGPQPSEQMQNCPEEMRYPSRKCGSIPLCEKLVSTYETA